MMKQKINASVRTSSLDSRAEILRMMKPAAEPIQLRRLRNAHFARREKILRETLERLNHHAAGKISFDLEVFHVPGQRKTRFAKHEFSL